MTHYYEQNQILKIGREYGDERDMEEELIRTKKDV
jgi:hypothetical protein